MQKNLPRYAADYDYITDTGWSMTDKERIEITERAEKLEEMGDTKGYKREMKKIPLAPNLAWMLRDRLGKKAFLKQGYNLADAEIAYGKNWIDEYNVINNNEGYPDE